MIQLGCRAARAADAQKKNPPSPPKTTTIPPTPQTNPPPPPQEMVVADPRPNRPTRVKAARLDASLRERGL